MEVLLVLARALLSARVPAWSAAVLAIVAGLAVWGWRAEGARATAITTQFQVLQTALEVQSAAVADLKARQEEARLRAQQELANAKDTIDAQAAAAAADARHSAAAVAAARAGLTRLLNTQAAAAAGCGGGAATAPGAASPAGSPPTGVWREFLDALVGFSDGVVAEADAHRSAATACDVWATSLEQAIQRAAITR